METPLPGNRQIIRNGALIALAWTMLIALSLGWDIHIHRQQSFELARHEAAAYISRDIAFRNWAASHGGVYVTPSTTTPPNPYLADAPDRDIVSTTGKRLTLMNPAYMLREVQSLTANPSWGKGHLTSLKPINPRNAPDDWEKTALLRLERGEKEVAEFVGAGADVQLRMMRPQHVEKACLKCHEHQGYREGDLRGGIAVALNMAPFLASARQAGMKSMGNHGLIWLFGLASVGFLTYRAQRREIERKQGETALRASEERLNEAQHIAHIGSWELDLASGKLHWSDEIFHIFGIDPAHFGARYATFLETIHPEDRERVNQAYSESVAKRAPYEIDHRLLMADGKVKWVHERGETFYGDQGKPLKSLGTVQDITEHKLAEQEVLQHRNRLEEAVESRTRELSVALASLRAGEQRQRLLFESSRDALMLLAPPSWKFTGANRATLQMFGASSVAEFTALGPWDVSPERQPDGRPSSEKAREMIETAMRVGSHFFEWEHQRLDGQPFAADVLLTRMEVGEEVFLQATVRDITERQQAEEALRQLNETLEQRIHEAVAKNMEHERLLIQQSRLAAMGEMVQNIAHQWRQPLNTVGLILQNIALDYEENLLTPSSLQRYADNGKDLVQKMTATIDDFRDFFTPQREKVDFALCQAIDGALNIVNASFLNHGIAIAFERGEDAQVTGYPNELSQVLVNLLGNAKEAILEHRAHGGSIDISLGQDSDSAWVAVRDNGGGIAEDILAKIFDPYFTTKEKGTGIGLYMSRMIMAHMDGTLAARNCDGGAEFRVIMPKSRCSRA